MIKEKSVKEFYKDLMNKELSPSILSQVWRKSERP